ncbi:rod shape-determining protein MreD [Thalassococcus profundi]|uniref:Rod shape-determining protein MreD n=1 Tax=Thalassococcus profundi TaxID=2282382 RepID=A0A369TS01_9RHOB|nr:rod shape-determining protein MreD [Thalassococcus profundi]RDD67950.1 rod shape-determining protein MreD [Thalassococcus profundi]
MVDQGAARTWTMRAAFVLICLVIVFFHLLPLETTPRRWAAPDLIVALCFAWALRRPDYVPTFAVAGVMLLADLVFQRPPGLWAALVVLAVEWLKSRERRHRDNTFVLEWITVAGCLLAITLVYRLILLLLIVAPGTMFLTLIQYVMTLAFYPVVVVLSHLIFGVRRSTPGEVDRLGHSL